MMLGASFTVGGVSKHTYDDWGLYMKVAKIAHPKRKSKSISIPGSDGSEDLMTYISSGVERFENRNVTIPLLIPAGCIFEDKVSEISCFLNGRLAQVVLDENPGYYFEGFCSLSNLTQNEIAGEFSITLDCFPYKKSVQTIDEDYLWDSFDLEDGIVYSRHISEDVLNDYRVVDVAVEVSGTCINIETKRMPTEPEIIVTGGNVDLSCDGSTYKLTGSSSGLTNYPVGLLLTEGTHAFEFTLEDTSIPATVTIRLRNGVF